MRSWNSDIQKFVEDASGFLPRTWILMGPGIPREEIKALLLQKGRGISGTAVQSLSQLAAMILKVPKDKILDQPFSRQEILRALVDRSIRGRVESELRRHRRQRTFFKKLDRAVQSSILSFSTDQHRESVLEFVRGRTGENVLREEIIGIASGYVAFLESQSLLDPNLLLLRAAEKLEAEGVTLAKPERLVYLSAQAPQGLESRFLEALKNAFQIPLEVAYPLLYPTEPLEKKLEILKWHSLEDAAYAAAERATQEEIGIVIPDTPSVRRSLMRALHELGGILEDPRDPTVIKRSELLKRALLPLEIVGRGFRREDVLKFERNIERVREVQSRGIRSRLESYRGGKLSVLFEQLEDFQNRFGHKYDAESIQKAHLGWMAEKIQAGDSELSEIFPFFLKLWQSIETDLTRLGWQDRKFRTALWVERLALRIQDASPPVIKLRNGGGIRLYRLNQIPAHFPEKAVFLGLPSDFISGARVGDHFLTQRDREIVRNDFEVRSAKDLQAERQALLKNWLAHSEVQFQDYEFDWDGSEREGVEVALLEAEISVENFSIETKGAHPRFAPCFDEIQTEPPQKVYLPFETPLVQLKATELEAWSRCPFRGLARLRWKIEDIDEPEMDLRSIDRGILLHEAIKFLLNSRDEEGVVRLSLEEAIARAWESQRPRHFLKAKRLEAAAKKSLIPILVQFMTAEFKYFEKTKAKSIMLDNQIVETQVEGVRVFGQPDRVDAVPGGLFVMDFKSGQAPSSTQMIESGYRLQLPFYAVATQKLSKERITGLQFIILDRKGSRSRGIYFTEFNGKIYTFTKANKNVVDENPEIVLQKCEENIQSAVAMIQAGEFSPSPRIPARQECPRCPEFYLCGRSRVRVAEEEGVVE